MLKGARRSPGCLNGRLKAQGIIPLKEFNIISKINICYNALSII